jgi:DNA-directed RNA polymerase subunit RPC12/RpoP
MAKAEAKMSYVCTVCGHRSDKPSVHCGQKMVQVK